MSKEEVILQVLRDIGVYDRIRGKVNSDQELARLFDEDFQEFISIASSISW